MKNVFHRSAQRGQALTELAIALPVLLLMLFGLIEVGFMIKTKLVLQDAVRSALRYGSIDGTNTGNDGCLADKVILDALSSRIQNSLVDSSHVRSILIYTPDPNGSPFTMSELPGDGGTPVHPWTGMLAPYPTNPIFYANASDVYGDYYYSDYNSSGANIDYNSSSYADGSGEGAVWKLFNGQVNNMFARITIQSVVLDTPVGDTTFNLQGDSKVLDEIDGTSNITLSIGTTSAETVPLVSWTHVAGATTGTAVVLTTKMAKLSAHGSSSPTNLVGLGSPMNCGATLNNWTGFSPYWDGNTSAHLESSATTLYVQNTNVKVHGSNTGNWPPFFRNNHTGVPQSLGVDVVYDYQFHTPVFQVISNLLIGGQHFFRMDEHSAYYLDPA